MQEAKCRKNRYCRFEIVKDYPDAIKEICVYCSRTMIWKKDRFGRIDNRDYARHHLRDFCQPYGMTAKYFAEIYGEEAYEKALKHRPDRKTDWDEAGEDARRMVRELRKEKVIV